MPELPEVDAVRRELAPAMRGARFERVRLGRKDLRRPFPSRFRERLQGQTVRTLTRRGKYLVAGLSSGETLLMHLGMSGSFDVARQRRRAADSDENADPHDHVVFEMSSGATITYNDPRRFGVMDLVAGASLERHLARIGPEPLSADFDATSLARACAGKRTSLKAALLDQRVVAGLGNIYASEALHVARLSPRRRASTIATATGLPHDAARRLTSAIKAVLHRAIERSKSRDYRTNRFRVYDRAGEKCPTRGCPGTIRRITQAGRSTFYCPVCQT
jgi:formamidopyrimidine-DNA glycosylase